MAAIQQDAIQQPAGATQQDQAASYAPTAQVAPNDQAQAQGSGVVQGPDQGSDQRTAPDFSQLLQQQIAQAIQPVLDDFRRQVTQTVEQQAPSAPAAITQTGTEQAHSALAQQPTSGTSAGQLGAQPQGLVQEALQPALKTVERQSEEWLSTVLVSALTALLTESAHQAVQQSAERSLHAVMQKLFEAAPADASNQEIQLKIERTLQSILKEALDVVFAEHTRSTLQQGGQAAIQGAFHGDFSGALRNVENIVTSLGEALLTVLRQEWPTLVRLALALTLLALESSIGQSKAQEVDASQAHSA